MAEVARDESGQAIILAGFAIAIGMVVVAVYLNAMIFSGNLDARGIHVNSEEISEITYLTVSETEFQIDRVYEMNDTPSDVKDSYVSSMQNYSGVLQRMPSLRSAVVRIDVTENQTAWQMVQDDPFDELDGVAGDEKKWKVADSIDHTYVMDFNISLSDLDESEDNLTRIKARTSSDTKWQMYVVNDSMDFSNLSASSRSEDTVVIKDETGTVYTYPSSSYGNFNYGESNYLEIEVFTREGNATINGVDTGDNLQFPSPGDFDRISIEWGNTTEGKYEIRVNGSATGKGPCSGAPCRESSNWATGVIHRSNYTLSYVHPLSTHQDNISVTLPREAER